MMWRWFKRADGLAFCFAGIWRPWTGDRGIKKTPNVRPFDGTSVFESTRQPITRCQKGAIDEHNQGT